MEKQWRKVISCPLVETFRAVVSCSFVLTPEKSSEEDNVNE